MSSRRSIVFTDDNIDPLSLVTVSDGVVSQTRSVAHLVARLPPYVPWSSLSLTDKKNELKRVAFEILGDANWRAAFQAEGAAEEAGFRAERAAEHLVSVCSLIRVQPASVRSNSPSRVPSPDIVPAPAEAPLDDEPAFMDFVGTWAMPSSDDAAWCAASDGMLVRFQAMLSTPITTGWQRGGASDTVQTRLAQLVEFRKQNVFARDAASFPCDFKTKVTRPFVFAVLKEATPLLAPLLPDATLHLYTGNVGSVPHTSMNRHVAAMLFGDAETNVSQLDAGAWRDALVTVVVIRLLNAQSELVALTLGDVTL
jgi:hypothetical protein